MTPLRSTTRRRFCLVLAVCLVTLATGNSLFAGPVNRVSFSRTNGATPGGTLSLWLGTRDLKVELRDAGETLTMIYRAGENPPALYLLPSDRHTAQRVTRPEVKDVSRYLHQKFRELKSMMEQVPPEQRRQLSNALPFDSEPDLSPPPEPRLEMGSPVTWRGRAAREGTVRLGADTAGRVVLLDSSVVAVNEDQRTVLRDYQSLLDAWIGLLRNLPTMREENPVGAPGNRLGLHYLRLAEFEHGSNRLTLTDWERTRRPADFFSVPDSYRVQSIGSLIQEDTGSR